MPQVKVEKIKQGSDVARFIDHTLLLPTATTSQIESLCREALESKFFSVCIAPTHVFLAKRILKDSNVKICTVIGFPTGIHSLEVKNLEALQALKEGADELDMVVHQGAAQEKNDEFIYREISSIKKNQPGILKVILETCNHNEERIKKLTEVALEAKADFVKTSTGFGKSGATIEAVKIMRGVVGSSGNVKASGGIRSFSSALSMLDAGANRLGTSAGLEIIKGLSTTKGDY